MTKRLDEIDRVLAKPRQEWSDEEFDMVIDWRVECKMNEEEYNMKIAAMQETMLESAEASYMQYEHATATLDELKQKAFELLERASL